ncbi:phage tail tape measure protein [Pseudomonas soli]|uniref:Phage tail tape measure protein, lambda family n=1 Tax=Pseudomonas soli TaxID=1306993 RepID=A0A1H9Q5D6_9PSED|nr:phage tail tape measure protein [Pseudomonas soli]SER55335.1 phage tail tape measure protein, lambda family [Pseudomonas soli]
MSQGDIAVLGIKVESGEAAAAADDLDKLTKAGERAEAATGSVGAQAKSSGVSIKDLGASTQSAEKAIDRYTRQAQAAGMSTKAYTAALRGVPAQFTDIIVSLQGGMNPLTVMLQQGGQLKDMFGGIGPAARALSGYVAGLVNPFTIAGAAVAGLGVAYYKGSEEAQDFRKALILTGNAAGTNAGAMSDLARQISTTVGTTGAAAEVLAQLANNGKIAGDSIGTVATAALQMKDATGRAVEETVAEFVKIGKDPVAAAKELNEQYNFLTASTYAQIAALKEQGDTVGAAKLLTDTYAQTIDTRSKEIVENLGWIEKAWRGVWGMTKSAGDAALNFGRTQGIADQLTAAQADLADLEKRAGENKIVAASAQLKSERELLQSRITALGDQLKTQQAIDQAQENYRKRQRDSIIAMHEVDTLEKSAWNNAEKRADALQKYDRALEKIRKTDPNDARLKPETIARVRADIEEQYKDPATKKTPAYREDAATKALDQARQQYSVLQQQNGLIGAQRGEMQKLGEAGQALVKWEQQLADIKDKKVLTADQKSLLANQQQITAQLQKNAGLEKEMQLRKLATEEAQKLAAFQGNLNSQLQRASLGLDSNLASMGLGDVARQRMQERLSIEQQYQQQLDNLEQQHNEGRISKGLYEKESDALRKALDDRLAMQTKYYEDVDAAQADWSLGARSAFASYLEQARDVAGQTRTLFSNAFSSMEDAVANFAITGKLSFSDFTKSVLADMARIATRQAITGIAGSLFGSAIGGFFGGGASAVGEGTMTGFSEGSFVPNAKGGVYESPSLSHFSNQVHSSPQFFAFAKGAGVFGEAGPEAIMPLTRAPDGNLGVRAVGGSGAGGSTSISVNAPVNISVPDRSGEGMELDQGLLQQNMQKQMEIAAQKAVAESWRPGGISHRNATRRT